MRTETQYAIYEQPNFIQNRPESRAKEKDITNMKNETYYAICERPNIILNQPHMSDSDCQLSFPGRGVDISNGGSQVLSRKLRFCEQVIQERTQDLSSSAVEDAAVVLLGNSMD